MRLPTQILLLGAILTNGARANDNDNAPAVEPASASKPAALPDSEVVQLEPVRVTADLWETPLEKISASVSVYDGAQLAREGVRHFGDMANQIPNLTYTGGTSRPRYFQIRGIGENSQYEGETPDSSVAFKVDDLDFTGLGGLGSTFDVRQVEVLRGPQAGAFGANAAGGVIRIVTNDPTPYWTGVVEGSAGEDNLREGGFAVGGPLLKNDPEKLMFRLAVQQHASDGFRRNVTTGSATNARDEVFGRLKITFNPNDSWRWDATVLASDQDNGFDEFALDNNGTVTFSDEPGRDEQRALAGSVRGVYAMSPDVVFTTVTGGATTDSVYSYDSDWTAASYEGFIQQDRERETLNQEFRFDGESDGVINRWTLGLYAQRLDELGDYFYRDPFYLETLNYDYRSDNAAVFGQVGRDLGERTRLIAGLRVEHVRVRADSAFDNTFTPAALSPRFSDTLWGGKITLEHDLAENVMGFVSAARGYKAGGVNVDARIDTGAGDPVVYDTETLWNYEVGLRGRWLEQRLNGELTLFFIDRHDTQVRDSAGFGGSYRFYTDNGDRSFVYGLESAVSYAVTDTWTVHASLGLMESDLEAFTLTNGDPAGGRRLANTPKTSYSVGIRYRAPQGLFGHVELTGRSSVFDSNNQNEARRAFNVVNASIGYERGSWRFTVWGRNLFDEYYENRVFFFDNGFGDQRYENRADPRQVGVSAAYRF